LEQRPPSSQTKNRQTATWFGPSSLSARFTEEFREAIPQAIRETTLKITRETNRDLGL